MSMFIDAIIDLLPEHNSLKNPNNELRKVLENTVGAWFDNRNIQDFYDNLFLNYATGKWLDLHGNDYGVTRQAGESDEDYRVRIVQDVTEHLTPEFLKSVFDVEVFVKVDEFDPSENMLTSDNFYITQYGYMASASQSVEDKLDSKFVLDGGLEWF